ncbi:TrlF family AAA-like ATPase [Oleiphilus sp. HI0066]|uniref:TrlF family AAA-like ATPase n=1 Tax=Oleiphilus sp. HI0066 TaxID=1822242 RepID=UPI0035162E81
MHRGSEWNKWDLHVHTPESILNNQFNTDWDTYVQTLFKKAYQEQIFAVGITDYFSIDGYTKLRKDYLGNDEKLRSLFSEDEISHIKNMLIVPNIEFRLSKFITGNARELSSLNRKLNFHVILSDELSIEEIQTNFLQQVTFDSYAETGSPAHQMPLTKTNLENYGKALKEEHSAFRDSGRSDLYIGMMNAGVDESNILKTLGHPLFADKYLLGINPDEDLSRVSWSSSGHASRKNLIKQAHFMFTANPGTVRFMQGEFHDSQDEFIQEFGTKKPCLWGSDAHDLEKLLEPDENRLTWIKAELSFRGLKQVVYDPESRVRIQHNSPQSKSEYQTIKAVKFIDGREQPEFSLADIPISKDLTSIIGGKSSGKSLLLHHIAKAINHEAVKDVSSISNSSTYEHLARSPKFDFEVTWDNGDISKLNELENTKPITYIPQLYINQLAENDGKDHLNELVKSILCQNDKFKEFITSSETRIAKLELELSNSISEYFLLRSEYENQIAEKSRIGEKKAIEKESTRLELQIKTLQEKSGFSETENELYQHLTKRLSTLNERKETLQKLYHTSNIMAALFNDQSSSIFDSLKLNANSKLPSEFNSKFVSKILDNARVELTTALHNSSVFAKTRAAKTPELIQKLDKEIQAVANRLTPLSNKVKDQEALAALNKTQSIEKEKLNQILGIEQHIQSINARGKEVYEQIVNHHKQLTECYLNISNELTKTDYQLDEGIGIKGDLGINTDKFNEFIKSFDRRTNLEKLFPDLFDESGFPIFRKDTYNQSIEKAFSTIKSKVDAPTLKKGVSLEIATKRLFSNCFEFNYIVNYNGDEIAHMSPGKRGLVLLNLLLHLSNATHPILIDQPEDNLDNRTIYDLLKGYIRQRKNKRQIIIVTHNANLVVASDSECVVVANQSGQVPDKENKKHKFEYCAGAIEHSFISPEKDGVLYKKGIREHVCEILEGGVIAFQEREMKYGFKF